jgi:DNA polymerase III subunit gamma/tau
MVKKVLVSVIAAGALSVPLAGVAGADPADDNPGVPGNIGGQSPGSVISGAAKAPGLSTPEAFGGSPPGQSVKQVTPGHAPPPPDEDPTPPPDEVPTPPADEVPTPPADEVPTPPADEAPAPLPDPAPAPLPDPAPAPLPDPAPAPPPEPAPVT